MSAPISFAPPPLDPVSFFNAHRSGNNVASSGMIPHMSHYIYKPAGLEEITDSCDDDKAAANTKTCPNLVREESASDSSTSSSSEAAQTDGACTNMWQSLPLPSQRLRLNKFVRRLHDMLVEEKDSGIVEWRKGLLVLHSTVDFTKSVLPKHFNTRNFKTFRRQLNYYGFIHVRSFSSAGSATTALWVNRELANAGSDDLESVLLLKRVEPCETAKTVEGRRVRKEQAIHTVEEDLGINAKSLQMDQIRAMALRLTDDDMMGSSAKHGAFSPSRAPFPSLALPPPPPLALLPTFVAPIVKEDDKANAANLLLMLSKSG